MASQPIKYAETTVEASQSVAEVTELVRRYGASRFEQRWNDEGQTEAIRFTLRASELGDVPVVLRARTERILEILREAHPYTTRRKRSAREHDAWIRAQAYRIAWRHLRDLTEQLLLAAQLGLRTVASAFMADLEIFDETSGETVTMEEYLGRRAVLEPDERGLRLLSTAEAPRVHMLPPARGDR
jgi:hypothetical protein